MNFRAFICLACLCVSAARCGDGQDLPRPADEGVLVCNSPEPHTTFNGLELLTAEEQDKLIKETLNKVDLLDERLMTEINSGQSIDKSLEELKSLREVFVKLDSIRHDQGQNIWQADKVIVCGKIALIQREYDEWLEQGIPVFWNNDLGRAAELVAIYDQKEERWLEAFKSSENFVNYKQSIENLKENRRHLDSKFLVVKKEVEEWENEIIRELKEWDDDSNKSITKLLKVYDERFEEWVKVLESADSDYGCEKIERLKECRKIVDNLMSKNDYIYFGAVVFVFFVTIGVRPFLDWVFKSGSATGVAAAAAPQAALGTAAAHHDTGQGAGTGET